MAESPSFPISLFIPNPWNFNILTDDELQALANDIRTNGIKQKIVVRKKDDALEIIDGYHKIKALKLNGVREVSAKDVEIRELSNSEVRTIVRSLKVRGSRKNLLKESMLYKIDFEESGLSQSDYADRIGVDQGNLSKILKRSTTSTYPAVQQIMMDTDLSPFIIDEVLTARPDYHLQLLNRASAEHWSVDDARQAVKLGISIDGEPIKPKSNKADMLSDSSKLDLYDRVAISNGLSDIAISITKVANYAKSKGAPHTSESVEQLLTKLYKLKNVIDGNRTVYQRDGGISKVGELLAWFSKGSDDEQRVKNAEVEKRVQEMIK